MVFLPKQGDGSPRYKLQFKKREPHRTMLGHPTRNMFCTWSDPPMSLQKLITEFGLFWAKVNWWGQLQTPFNASMVRSKKWCYSHLTAFSSDFVAHDDEPYTIGSSSVRYHLFLPAWLLFTIILAKFAIYNVFFAGWRVRLCEEARHVCRHTEDWSTFSN